MQTPSVIEVVDKLEDRLVWFVEIMGDVMDGCLLIKATPYN